MDSYILSFALSYMVLFFFIMAVMVLYAKKRYKKETLMTVSSNDNLWEITDEWAVREGFTKRSENDNERLYQKGKNIISAPCYIQVEKIGENVDIKGWMFVNYFIVSTEIAYDEPGYMGRVIRKKRMQSMENLRDAIIQK